MFWHVEITSRYHTGFVLLHQQAKKIINTAARQFRKDDGAEFWPAKFQIAARCQERIQRPPVRVQELPGASSHSVETVERDHAEQLRRMRPLHTVEIVDVPHALRQLWSGQYPATSQAAQSVRLGQAAGNQEVIAQVERRLRPPLEQCFQIYFIYQHE